MTAQIKVINATMLKIQKMKNRSLRRSWKFCVV